MPHKGRILIVDDNIELCETLSDILRDERYLPYIAYNGKQALEMVQQTNFHQAIVDVMLPDMDGVMLITDLQSLKPGLSCLSMTAYPRPKLKEDSSSAGAREFFVKPVDVPHLLKSLDEVSGIPLLIIEDDQSFGDSLKNILDSQGYKAYLASEWTEVKEVLKSITPDGAIIDLGLPGKSGFLVMKALKNRFPWLKAIMVTGRTDMELLMKEALQEKALAGFTKPVPIEKLLAILEKFLNV